MTIQAVTNLYAAVGLTDGTIVTTNRGAGDKDHYEIVDDFIVVCDGNHYVDGMVHYANGTVVVTIKIRPPSQENIHG